MLWIGGLAILADGVAAAVLSGASGLGISRLVRQERAAEGARDGD